MLAAVEVDDPQAVHEVADHVDRRRLLQEQRRPDARHDQRHAGRPALADVVAIDLVLGECLRARVVVHLRFGRQLERLGHELPRLRAAQLVLPGARQVERRRAAASRSSPASARRAARRRVGAAWPCAARPTTARIMPAASRQAAFQRNDEWFIDSPSFASPLTLPPAVCDGLRSGGCEYPFRAPNRPPESTALVNPCRRA